MGAFGIFTHTFSYISQTLCLNMEIHIVASNLEDRERTRGAGAAGTEGAAGAEGRLRLSCWLLIT